MVETAYLKGCESITGTLRASPKKRPRPSPLWDEISNQDAGLGRAERRDGLVRREAPDLGVAPTEHSTRRRLWVPVDLQHPIDEIDDPVFRHLCAGVEAALPAAIEGKARVGYFHEQDGLGRMRGRIVPPGARHDGQVGVGLGLVVERDGTLAADVPAGSERRTQRILGETDRRHMGAVLRLARQQVAGDELDVILGTKGTEANEPLVLEPRPALRANR